MNKKLLFVIIVFALVIFLPFLVKIYYEKFKVIEKYGIRFVLPVSYLEAFGVKSNYNLNKLFMDKNLTRIYLFINNESKFHNLTATGYFIIVNNLVMFYEKNGYNLTLSVKILNYTEILEFKLNENEIGIVLLNPDFSDRAEIFVDNRKVFLKYKNEKELDKVLTRFIVSSLNLI